MSILLTNKSSRIFTTSHGAFRPGTSEEFSDKEAIGLMGFSGEIIRTSAALGVDLKKMNAVKDEEIKKLKAEVKRLESLLKTPATDAAKDKRIAELEKAVADVKVSNSKYDASLKHLKATIEDLKGVKTIAQLKTKLSKI